MIYIYSNKFVSPLAILTSKYIFYSYNIECRIINDLNKIDTEDAIVLPIDIEASKECFRNKIEGALVSSEKTYEMLDDKNKCYEFVKKLNIPIIPTFSCSENTQVINFVNSFPYNQIFIAKENGGKGSNGMVLLSNEDLINKCSNNELGNFVIQPYLDNNILYSFNVVCKDGVIVSSLLVKQETLYNRENIMKKNITSVNRTIIDETDSIYHKVRFLSVSILNKTKYSGICEIEYLYRNNENKLLFLEVNPRISGHIMLIYEDRFLYIDKIIIPYLNTINELKQDDAKYKFLNSEDNLYLNNENYSIKTNRSKEGFNLRIVLKMVVLFLVIVIALFFLGIYVKRVATK